MKMSAKGLDKLKEWEGTGPIKNNLYMKYRDSAGYWTIGYGHLLTKSELTSGKIYIGGVAKEYKGGLTKEESLKLLDQDNDIAEKAVNESVKYPLNQNQFDALVSLTFNIGVGAFQNSTLLKLINSNQFDKVPAQFLRWNKAGGRTSKGLINRRSQEVDLWLGKI